MLFNEPPINKEYKQGRIEVICGPMFSGKTEELLRRLRRAKIANIPTAIFKPKVDTRYSDRQIVSHDANYFPSLPVSSSKQILKHRGDAKLIAIDEAQFFDDELPDIANTLALEDVRVILAGLDMDSMGRPFGVMPRLLAIADYITKLNAICVICGNEATHSFRHGDGNELIKLGEKNVYEPRCRRCFNEGLSG